MPISYRHNVLFIHIHKTGGQSISALMGISRGRENFYAEELTHLTVKMYEDHLDISDMYLFTFVRNPYDKIKSEYAWRMKNRMSVVFNEPTKHQMTFDKYMETLYERWPIIPEKEWRTRAHVMPQHVFIDDRVEVFRHEEFTKGCNILKEKFHIEKPIPHVNRGCGGNKHTRRTMDIVNELYGEDFERFGYEIK